MSHQNQPFPFFPNPTKIFRSCGKYLLSQKCGKIGKTQKNYRKNPRFSGFSTVFQQPVRFFFFTGFFPCGTRLFSTFSTACFSCFHRVIFEFSTGVEKLVENFCRNFAFPTIKENLKKIFTLFASCRGNKVLVY